MRLNILLIVLIGLVSCSDRRALRIEKASVSEMRAVPMILSSSEADEAGMVTPLSPGIYSRKVIKNATLSFKTDDVKKTKEQIDEIIKSLGAYSASENQNNGYERLEYHQQIRIPSERFDMLIQKIETLSKEIENKNINTQDVTEEFIDLEARLKTKKELEVRYHQLLKQANKVSEVLSIEKEIGNVRTEIESMEGRLNYLKNQVSLSTLNLTFYQTLTTDFGYASKFVSSLRTGWENLLSFIIGLVSIWPFLIMLSFFVWLIYKWIRKKLTVNPV